MQTAVQSVLGQTHSNLELVVLDDASTDDTWSILESFRDARVRLYRHEINQGAHNTLNEAMQLARGEFLAFINSDDVYAPDRLTACLTVLQSSGVDLVGTDIELIDEHGRAITEHWWITAFESLKHLWDETRDWTATLLEGNVFMTTSNFCFRRSWFEAVGGFKALRYVLDYEWLLRGLVKGRRLAWVDTPLLQYRMHGSNTIRENPMAANLECARMLRERVPELLGNGGSLSIRLMHLASQWARIETYLVEIAQAQRHEALVAKEAELFQLIADRDRWIEQRDGWVAERDVRIQEMATWVAQRDRWIAERDARIKEMATWVAQRDRWIADRDGWIAERDARIMDQQVRIDAGARELTECRAYITAVHNSPSFRIGRALTRPARWLRKVFDGIRGNGKP